MAKKNENSSRRNKKYLLISLGLGGILLAGTIAGVAMSSGQTPLYGGLGSAHEHAAFMVVVNGEPINFSQSKYQVKSQYIHVEERIGTILHKHAVSVPMGAFFDSLKMQVTNSCFVSDDGMSYCNGDGNRLRVFINGFERTPATINNYVLNEGDRLLVYYGEDSNDVVTEYLRQVDALVPTLPDST